MKLLPLILFILLLHACNHTPSIDSRVNALRPSEVSTGGVSIRTELNVSYAVKQAMERGIIQALTKAVCAGYAEMQLTDFRVAFLAGKIDADGIPYIEMDAGKYAGTAYDKGGVIHAAGEYMPDLDMMVIPLAGNPTESHFEEIAEHEATHRIYFLRDRPKFEATAVHRAGQVFLMADCLR